MLQGHKEKTGLDSWIRSDLCKAFNLGSTYTVRFLVAWTHFRQCHCFDVCTAAFGFTYRIWEAT